MYSHDFFLTIAKLHFFDRACSQFFFTKPALSFLPDAWLIAPECDQFSLVYKLIFNG